MKALVGIDLGTSATKTVLFDFEGNVIASESREYPMVQEKNGWAEQDPELWWQAAKETIGGVISKSGIDSGDIAGVGLSGQMHGLVMLDRDGKVLRPAILWCDQRTGEEAAELTEIIGAKRLIDITANPAMTGFTAAKILWVRKHEPEIYEKCAHILLPKDYLRYKLTGEFATEVSDASGMQLLDIKNRRFSREILDLLDIDPALLARVYESPEITGEISSAAAAATGLRPGTPVSGGGGDNACAAVGTGVVREGRAFTTIGSSGVVYAHTKEMHLDPKGRVHTFCCAVPGAWHVMGVTQGAGLSLKWFRDEFCGEEKALAKTRGEDVYNIMDAEAEESPIGANRLIYLPYLMGERTPHLDPDCRGVFFGLSAMHRRRDLIRAVMEGVTYSLLDCLNILREMGVTPSEMLACGGGGSSPMWRQMLSDVFELPVRTPVSKEGPALGAAILAGVGAGIYSSVEEGCDAAVRYNPAQEPRGENFAKYREVYRLYTKLYPALKTSFGELSKLSV